MDSERSAEYLSIGMWIAYMDSEQSAAVFEWRHVDCIYECLTECRSILMLECGF